MDDVIDFPKSRVKPLTEEEALAYLRREGPIEGIGAFAKLVGWERTGAGRTVKEWDRDGKVVRTTRPGYPTVIEAAVATLPAVQGMQTAVQPPAKLPLLHTPAQPAQADAQPAQPAPSPRVLAWCRWILGAVLIVLSAALYIVGLNLNATFWPGLDPTGNDRNILGAGGVIIESNNYVAPSAIALAPSQVRLVAWGFWSVTMAAGAIAEASFVKSNLGASEVARNQTKNERSRLEGIIAKPMEPVSDASVVDARSRVDTAKVTAKADCAPTVGAPVIRSRNWNACRQIGRHDRSAPPKWLV